MATSDSPLSVPNVTLAVARGSAAPAPTGSPLVRFDFANGDTATTPSINQTGFSFSSAKPISLAPNSRLGMEFPFESSASILGDSSAEVRYNIGQDFTDLYIKKILYFPANYRLRVGNTLFVADGASVSTWQPGDTLQMTVLLNGIYQTAPIDAAGIVDDPEVVGGKKVYIRDIPGGEGWAYIWRQQTINNLTRGNSAYVDRAAHGDTDSGNKFHALWSRSTGYSTGNATTIFGFRVNQPEFTGLYESLTDASATGFTSPEARGSVTRHKTLIDPAADAGREVEYVIRTKRSTSATSYDGVYEIWKDGQIAFSAYNTLNFASGDNTLGQGYILGYSNSGFDELTTVYMPLFEVYGSNKPSGLTGGQ